MSTECRSTLKGSVLVAECKEVDSRAEIASTISRRVVDFENGAVKAALIQLGWTPPKSD